MKTKKSWDKRHYKSIYDFTVYELNHLDFRLVEKYGKDPLGWAATFLPQVSACIHREDFEAAKAMSDAIREFCNRWLTEPVSESDTLRLPPYEEKEVHGILCLVDPKCPGGMKGDGAILF